jgi:hypothetical protein
MAISFNHPVDLDTLLAHGLPSLQPGPTGPPVDDLLKAGQLVLALRQIKLGQVISKAHIERVRRVPVNVAYGS